MKNQETYLASVAVIVSTKQILYKTVIFPMLLYDVKAWTLLNTDAAALKVFERKVLRKIFDPLGIGDDFRIRSNNVLHKPFNNIDVVQRISIQRLC